MSTSTIDLVGKLGDPTTQGLGRLISQYVKSPKLVALLTGIYQIGQDLENLMQRMSRLLNPNDNIYYTPDGGVTFPVNTYPATGDQLRIIGGLVGVTKYLPGGAVLDDPAFWQLIQAKIYRNSAVANSPGLRMSLWWIFDPVNALAMQNGAACSSVITMLTIGTGRMSTRVALIYPVEGDVQQPTAVQLQLLHLTAGRSNLPYGLIARMAGSQLDFQWQPNTGVFSFSDINDGTHAPLTPGGVGWTTTSGVWASAFA